MTSLVPSLLSWQKNYRIVGLFLMALLIGCEERKYGISEGPSPGSDGERDASPSGQADANWPGATGADQNNPGNRGTPVVCEDDTEQATYADSGLPLLESNPGAPFAIYLDFGGGTYDGDWYDPYDIDGDEETFNQDEQEAITDGWRWTEQFYAMFDVNVTTDRKVRDRTGKWAWILIYGDDEEWDGEANLPAVGTPSEAGSVGGAHALTEENRGYIIAHELGHNFGLYHTGVKIGSTWHKWDEQPDFQEDQGGALMGGRGAGFFWWDNGLTQSDGMQDSMEIIREVLMDVGGSPTGWRDDDFDEENPEELCLGDSSLYRKGILEHPDDVDVFLLSWPGGTFSMEAAPVGVSAAQLVIELEKDGVSLGDATDTDSLEEGLYQIRVESNGIYGAIGAYEITIDQAG